MISTYIYWTPNKMLAGNRDQTENRRSIFSHRSYIFNHEKQNNKKNRYKERVNDHKCKERNKTLWSDGTWRGIAILNECSGKPSQGRWAFELQFLRKEEISHERVTRKRVGNIQYVGHLAERNLGTNREPREDSVAVQSGKRTSTLEGNRAFKGRGGLILSRREATVGVKQGSKMVCYVIL